MRNIIFGLEPYIYCCDLYTCKYLMFIQTRNYFKIKVFSKSLFDIYYETLIYYYSPTIHYLLHKSNIYTFI